MRHDLRHGLATLRALLSAAQDGGSLTPAQLGSLMDAAGDEVDYAVRLLDELPGIDDAAAVGEATPGTVGAADQRHSDVDAVLRTAARVLAGTGLSMQIESTGPLWVDVSATALTRVVRNLLDNAVSAVQPDGAILARAQFVSASPVSGDDGRYIRLEIHDDGPGPGSTGFSRTGGQGLEVVRSIVLPAQGWLVLGRSPLGGACVQVTLPEAKEEENDDSSIALR